MLYFVPDLYGGHKLGKKIIVGDLKLCQEMHAAPKPKCRAVFIELAYCLKQDIELPSNADDGLKLYEELISFYEHELH